MHLNELASRKHNKLLLLMTTSTVSAVALPGIRCIDAVNGVYTVNVLKYTGEH